MQTCIQSSPGSSPECNRRQSAGGFSLLEMVIAMFILSIGLLAVAQAISYSLMASNRGRGVTNAKMLIVSMLEQMETLRDTGQLHFNEISNSQVAGSTFTGFPATFQPVSTVPGADGIFGTADDLIDPATGQTNNAFARPGVSRKVIITTLPDNDYLKKIEVTLRYSPNGGEMKELVCYGYLNDNEHGNYIP
jgi:prepilin-type N-terminal cleavage/methylation domain-containing protein